VTQPISFDLDQPEITSAAVYYDLDEAGITQLPPRRGHIVSSGQGRQMRFFFGGASLVLMVAAGVLFVLPADATEPPAGMVMEVTGTTIPPMAEMTEISADTSVRLEPGAQLTFLHYRGCKLVTVAGGSVTLTLTDYRTDGTVVNDKAGSCPRIYTITDADSAGRATGGVIMRGLPQFWPVNPEIVFTGSRAGQVRAAAIYADNRPDQPLLRLILAGRHASCPPGTAPLLLSALYTLRLTMADQSSPMEIAFVGVASPGPNALVIERVD